MVSEKTLGAGFPETAEKTFRKGFGDLISCQVVHRREGRAPFSLVDSSSGRGGEQSMCCWRIRRKKFFLSVFLCLFFSYFSTFNGTPEKPAGRIKYDSLIVVFCIASRPFQQASRMFTI